MGGSEPLPRRPLVIPQLSIPRRLQRARLSCSRLRRLSDSSRVWQRMRRPMSSPPPWSHRRGLARVLVATASIDRNCWMFPRQPRAPKLRSRRLLRSSHLWQHRMVDASQRRSYPLQEIAQVRRGNSGRLKSTGRESRSTWLRSFAPTWRVSRLSPTDPLRRFATEDAAL